MINATPDKITFDQYVANVLAVLDQASPEQRASGLVWYRNAHDIARYIGDGDTRKGAGILAALSAQKTWSVNLALATDALAGNVHGHTADNLRKVQAILHGADPASVLPMEIKTGMFYRCILNPGDPTAVVIDRHAHDIAVGERWGNRPRGLKGKRYAMLTDVYRAAGRARGILPSQVQAITWLVWLDESTSNQGRTPAYRAA